MSALGRVNEGQELEVGRPGRRAGVNLGWWWWEEISRESYKAGLIGPGHLGRRGVCMCRGKA